MSERKVSRDLFGGIIPDDASIPDHIAPPTPGRKMPSWARNLIKRANQRTPGGFTDADMLVAWERCEGRCSVSGIDFSGESIGNSLVKRAYAPSLDQIKPGAGYTADNLRLVCIAVNFALNAWGDDVYLKVARSAVAKADADALDEYRGWYARIDASIRKAKRRAASRSGFDLDDWKRVIDTLKRAKALGPFKPKETSSPSPGKPQRRSRPRIARTTKRTRPDADAQRPLFDAPHQSGTESA